MNSFLCVSFVPSPSRIKLRCLKILTRRSGKAKQLRKRSLWVVNEHSKAVFRAASPSIKAFCIEPCSVYGQICAQLHLKQQPYSSKIAYPNPGPLYNRSSALLRSGRHGATAIVRRLVNRLIGGSVDWRVRRVEPSV